MDNCANLCIIMNNTKDTVWFRSMRLIIKITCVKLHYDMKIISGEKMERRDTRTDLEIDRFSFFVSSFGFYDGPYHFPPVLMIFLCNLGSKLRDIIKLLIKSFVTMRYFI